MMKNNFIIITLITLLYRIVGFFRDFFIATKFGAGSITDAFFISQTAPNLVLEFLALGGITSIIVANFNTFNKEELRNEANILIGNFTIISIVISIVLYIATDKLIKTIAPGFSSDEIKLTIKLTKMTVITFSLTLINIVISSFLVRVKKGDVISCSNLLYNSIVLIIGVFFSKRIGIEAFIIGINIATISRIVFILIFYEKYIGNIKFKINFKSNKFKKILNLLIPLIISNIGVQLNFIVDKVVASTLENGSISFLTYANKLIQLPLGVLLGSAILASYSEMIEKTENNNKFQKFILEKIELIFIVMGALIVYIALFSDLIISVLFNLNKITYEVLTASKIFKYLSVLLIITPLITLGQQIYFSLNETKVPAKMTSLCVGINIGLSLILVKEYKIFGIIISTIIANFINLLLIYIKLVRKINLKVNKVKIFKILGLHTCIYAFLYNLLVRYKLKIISYNFIFKILLLGILFIMILLIYYLLFRLNNRERRKRWNCYI